MDKKWIDGMKLNLSIIIIIIEMVKEGVIMKYKMEIPEAYHVSIISSVGPIGRCNLNILYT